MMLIIHEIHVLELPIEIKFSVNDPHIYKCHLSSNESLKNLGLNDETSDLCDAGAVLYQLSYQAIWELMAIWVHDKPRK